jgi:DNA-binding response OmpR family regulator
LRRYFEPDPSHPVHFQTVRGIGYRFVREQKRKQEESQDQ